MPPSNPKASRKTDLPFANHAGENSESDDAERRPLAESLEEEGKRLAAGESAKDHLSLYLRQTRHDVLSREQETEICRRVDTARNTWPPCPGWPTGWRKAFNGATRPGGRRSDAAIRPPP